MRRFFLLTVCLPLWVGCSPQSLFYYPNRELYLEPAALKIDYEQVQYPSLNGKKLWAILMKTKLAPKGTIVHFHGNFGNLSNHFPLSAFLLHHGFDVLVFDNQGYGASEGTPSPKKAFEDGVASVRYAQAHLRNPRGGVAVFGQSLGGATAIVVAAKEPLVRAAVIEAAFSSYSKMGNKAMRRHVLTWPLSIVAFTLSRKYDPARYVADVSPRPLFFIHGDRDAIVPLHMSQDLYARAREPKRLWIVAGANHLESKRVEERKYEQEVVRFFDEALVKSSAAR
jgi:fermentation-respiration switch protein FrsA (DUF1100 family)